MSLIFTEGTVTIELVDSSYTDGRFKRSVESHLPDNLHFRLSVEGNDVNLRLKRSALLTTVTTGGLTLTDDIEVR